MSDSNTPLDEEERLLVLQFLGVLHGWFQEERRVTEERITHLALQESIIKLLFARLTSHSIIGDPVFTEAGKKVFASEDGNTDDWIESLNRERHMLNAMDEIFTGSVLDDVVYSTDMEEEPVETGSNVIDFTTRKPHQGEED